MLAPNMKKIIFNLLVIVAFSKYTVGFSLNCRNDLLPNDYIIPEAIYDTDNNTSFQVSNPNCCQLQGKADIEPKNYKYLRWTTSSGYGGYREISFIITKLNEEIEPSQAACYYNFTLHLYCSNVMKKPSAINIKIPLIDTNNYSPFFNKPLYKYDLISTHPEDFKRLQNLHPIVATDYDVTNLEIVFSIEENKHFDIYYHGIFPNPLKKSHYAILVPKGTLTELVDLKITATDRGYPPRTATSRIIINPPSPPKPVFQKNIYLGHYFKNNTFFMDENLKLTEGVNVYQTTTKSDCSQYFYPSTPTSFNGEIKMQQYQAIDKFYEKNYMACVIEARYTDASTKLYSIGKTVLIVELHHDL